MTDHAYRPTPLLFERLAPEEQRIRLTAFRQRLLARRTVPIIRASRSPTP